MAPRHHLWQRVHPVLPISAYTATMIGLTLWTEQSVQGVPALQPGATPVGGRVAIIVPARNEARNIYRCVASLLAQQEATREIIVVNDHSTDETGPLLAALRAGHPEGQHLHLVEAPDLPPGWLGKPHACWVGAQHPAARSADWLLFVDADTWLHPQALSASLAEAERQQADLFTLFPAQQLSTVWERLMMPHIFYVLGVSFDWRRVNDPRDPLAIANGQFILIRRTVYEAVGGHEAVRTAIAEDQQLAERTKRQGYRLWLLDGRQVATTRMYTSLPEIWEGWSKNAYLGLGERSYLLGLAALGGAAAGLVPFALTGWVARRVARHPSLANLLLLVQTLAMLVVILRNRWIAMREMGVPRWYTFTLPLGAILNIALALTAWWKVASGRGVTWKGRRYASR